MLVWRQLRNTEIIFNSSAATSGNYVGWNLSTDGKFAKKEVDGACYLRLVADVASASIVSNQIIGYEVSLTMCAMPSMYIQCVVHGRCHLDVGRLQRTECKDVFGPGQKRDLESRIRQVFARCRQYEQGLLF